MQFAVVAVMFSHSVYNVNENTESLQAALVLSNSRLLSTPVNVQVTDAVGSNNGECLATYEIIYTNNNYVMCYRRMH